jgi:DNA-binding response OmpR family regulator
MPARKVLIADDDTIFTDTLLGELTKHADDSDLQFFTARRGDQCLRMAGEIRPDMILLDVQLPVINGFEVLAELQRGRIVTRVIMISGIATDLESAIRCVRAGACDYIVKNVPFDAKMLMERIRRNLLLENTTNLSLAKLSPAQQDLVQEAGRLRDEVEKLREENKKFRAQSTTMMINVGQKVALVAIALGGIYALWKLGFDTPWQLAFVFVVLLLMLLLPAEKVDSIRADVPGFFKARLRMRSGDAHQATDETRGLGGPTNR